MEKEEIFVNKENLKDKSFEYIDPAGKELLLLMKETAVILRKLSVVQ